jgi:enoyl-CoA hydratase
MPDFKYLQIRREGPVLVATMVNPPRNLLNAAMVEELHAVVGSIAEDPDVRVLVLTGGAEGIFITHYDVGELSSLSDAVRATRDRPASQRQPEHSPTRRLHPLNRLSLKLRDLPQPVIAAINGTAMGGGCELALACDFRIMATGGVLGLPEVRVGILPGAGGTQRMARMLGTAKALELMLLGDVVDAPTAERIGLVNRAVAPDRLMPEVMALANELASRPRLSLALIKQCVVQGSEMSLIDGLHFEQDAFMQTMRSEDASRLMRAYLKSERPLNEQ